ncbi:hypothetical protein ACFLZ1_02740 [Patescibacteria group bacterium]
MGCPNSKNKKLRGLGVCSQNNDIFLFYLQLLKNKFSFKVDKSFSGLDFEKTDIKPEIIISKNKKEDISKCLDFRIVKLKNAYLLTYLLKNGKTEKLAAALSEDLISWYKISSFIDLNSVGVVVPEYGINGKFCMFYGDKNIKVAISEDFKTWEVYKKPVLKINEPEKDLKLKIANIFQIAEGILVVYYIYNSKKINREHAIKVALFDKENPKKLLWQADAPIWKQHSRWENHSVYPLGVVNLHNSLVSYWNIDAEEIIAVNHHFSLSESPLSWQWRVLLPILNRHKKNPILKPIIKNYWESRAVFNPAAVFEDKKVHLLYRAVGDSDVSVLGYASSKDGLNIDTRSTKPVYVPREKFEGRPKGLDPRFNVYKSGIGFGGCEDPRLTKIKNRFYMTYVAYNGWGPPRVALTSIDKDDFLNENWNWEKPVLISRPNEVNKNACILPEKIKGNYVIFHRVFPHILIDFVDSLDFDGKTWLQGEHKIEPRQNCWDSRKVGIGPTPIKTQDGWLTIYHAVDDKDDSRYKMGAMLLDLEDPTKVVCRTNSPILEPTENYENEGHKYGVAYPCGAVAIDDRLLVYYGGADMVVCAAEANLNTFLYELKQNHQINLRPASL